MRKRLLKLVLLILTIVGMVSFLGLTGYCQDELLIEKSAEQAISQAITSLSKEPKVVNIQRIAVYPLEKGKSPEGNIIYDNEITDLLTIALSKTKYHVILRQELLKVMQEHGFVMGKVDLFNPESVKKLGSFLGVDAIIFGTVKEAAADLSGARVRLNLKMADVTTGELIWAEAVSGFTSRAAGEEKLSVGTAISYFLASNRQVLGWILMVIVAIIILKIIFAKRKQIMQGLEEIIPGYDYAKIENRAKTDRGIRNKIAGELARSIEILRETRDIAHKNNQQDVVNQLKDLSNSIDSLRLEVDNAEYGNSPFFIKQEVNPDSISRMVEFDRTFSSLTNEVALASKEIYEDAAASKIADVSGKVSDLQKKVSLLRVKFKDRKDYLRGMA